MAKRGKDSGLVICTFPTEGYHERVGTRGRGKGNTIRYRYVVKACKRCWEVGEQYEGYDACSVNVKFPTRVRDMHFALKGVMGDSFDLHPVSLYQLLRNINESVSGILKIKYDLKITEDSSFEEKNAAAAAMDEFYRLDYAKVSHEWVKARLAGEQEDEEEDGE